MGRSAASSRLLLACLLALAGLCGPAACSFFKKSPEAVEGEAGAGAPEAAAEPAVLDLPSRAQKAFEGRIAREANLEAIRLWEQALGENPRSVEILVSLARAHVWLAVAQTPVPAEKEKLLEKAKGYAEQALGIDKKHLGSKYWLAEALGHLAHVGGPLDRTLYRRREKALYKEVLDEDETYYYGGAHRYFGVFHAESSAIWGADFSKSYMHFRRAIDIEPRFFPSYERFVQVTLLRKEQKSKAQVQQDRAEARKLLRYVIETPSSSLPEAVPENEAAKERCRQILQKDFGESA